MKKILFLGVMSVFINSAHAQTSYTIYDAAVFYDGYAATVDEPVPEGLTRISNAVYTTKLSDEIIENLSEGALTMDVTIGALCDNYDRLGHVYLAFVDKGATSYAQNEVDRIEIARFITPFMNKNINPTEVPYHFTLDNISEIFNDSALLADYDIWVELEVFGVPYAAQTQVAGCSGRIDVFEGTLVLNVDDGTQAYTNPNFILPLSCREDLNNYNATDVPGETTKIINFTLDEPLDDAVLYLITSNHGANAGGEEYERRWHYVYLDDELIYEYMPGGKSCEPYRQFNTQGNGIYGATAQSLRSWLSFNNWCPGDKIPNREVILGSLPAGNHILKLDVPDAVFANDEGYFPISMYIQNRKSGQILCAEPTGLEITDQASNTIALDWNENGSASEWEIMYGKTNSLSEENYVVDADGETGIQITDLSFYYFYDVYVRSLCSDEFNSVWTGPVRSDRILATKEHNVSEINIYPNPVKDILQIDSKKPIERVQLFSMDGKKILSGNSSEIIVSSLSAGNYVLIIQSSDGNILTKKIVKE